MHATRGGHFIGSNVHCPFLLREILFASTINAHVRRRLLFVRAKAIYCRHAFVSVVFPVCVCVCCTCCSDKLLSCLIIHQMFLLFMDIWASLPMRQQFCICCASILPFRKRAPEYATRSDRARSGDGILFCCCFWLLCALVCVCALRSFGACLNCFSELTRLDSNFW